MKKQYTLFESFFYSYTIRTYHDGELIETYYEWQDDGAKHIQQLEAEGYTLAYTKEEFEVIKKKYELIRDNLLVEKEN